jgi:fructoselysine/glucoselysine PTS system EIIA component
MLHSVEMITGKQNHVWTLSAYVDGQRDLKDQIKDILKNLAKDDELIVVTDIFGGSVNNEFMNVLSDHQIQVIAGLNLPLAIELVSTFQTNKDTRDIIESALLNSKNSIKHCNLELQYHPTDEDF